MGFNSGFKGLKGFQNCCCCCGWNTVAHSNHDMEL